MREFEFDIGDAADRGLSGICGRWKLDDVRAALNAHSDCRGAVKTSNLFDCVIPRDAAGSYMLRPQHFGTLIAILCRDMASRPYRRFPNA